MRFKYWKIIILILFFLLIAFFIKQKDVPPKFAKFPPFQLIAEDGNLVNETRLLNRKTLFSFFFTSCQGPCPTLNANLGKIQKDLAADQELQLLSVSIDPERDTKEVLLEYAKKIAANLNNWHFLTGELSAIVKLSESDLGLGLEPIEYKHSTKVILIDQEGIIRGLFDSEDKESLISLKKAIQAL